MSNTAPTALDLNVTGPEDPLSVSILLSSTDPDDPTASGTPPTFRLASLPTHGTLYYIDSSFNSVLANTSTDYAAWTSDAGAWQAPFEYIPDPNWSGSTSFTYSSTDPGALVSNTATATIDITPVADPPVIDPKVNDAPDPAGPALQLVTGSLAQTPTVADLGGGRTLVMWQVMTDPHYIRAQVIDANGTVGFGFSATNPAGFTENLPKVAAQADGSFALTYVSDNFTSSGGGDIQTAFFAAGATTPTVVASTTLTSSGREDDPTIIAAGGGYVVTWAVEASGTSTTIMAQRYTAAGAAVGPAFTAATGAAHGSSTGANFDPPAHDTAAIGTDGSFVLVTNHDGSIQADLYDSSNANTHIVVDAGTSGSLPVVTGLAGGGFVVVWTNDDGAGNQDLYGQIYDAAGAVSGSQLNLTNTAFSSEFAPDVAGLPDGRFVVAWVGNSGAGGTYDIFTQVFSATGQSVQGDPVDTHPTSGTYEGQPAITVHSDGTFTVAWWQPGIWAETFHVDPGVVAGVAGTPIDLPSTVALVDTDGSEHLSLLGISGAPDGFTFNVGSLHAPGQWLIDRSTPDGAAFLDAWVAGTAHLIVTPPADYVGSPVLQLQAESEDPGGLSGQDHALSPAVLVPMLVTAPLNHAPVLSDTVVALIAENEDSAAPSGADGTLVSTLVGAGNVTDADASASTGLALTGLDTSHGSWFYSTDNGTSWSAVGAVSDANALLLAADAGTRLYFQPAANFNGSLASAITFRAWDQTSGTNGGHADTTSNGGTTAFSTATDTASLVINPLDDKPTVSSTAPFAVTEQVAQVINASLTVSDLELDALNGGLGDYAGAIFLINRQGGSSSQDFFDFASSGAFTVSGNKLLAGGLQFAHLVQTGGLLNIDFDSSQTVATTALVNDVLGHLRYTNLSDSPPAGITLFYLISDGAPGGGQGPKVGINGDNASATVAVTINAVNDAPVLDAIPARQITDTAGDDTFADLTGTITATDPDSGDTRTFSIDIGVPDASQAGFDTSATLPFGKLYLNSGSGAYKFVANDSAIEAEVFDATMMIQISVTDGSGASDTKTLRIDITGANDNPDLAPAGPVTETDTSGNDSFPDFTGTLTASDRDAGDSSTFSITGGAASADPSFTYQKIGTYGTLYVNTISGAWKYVANDIAVEAVKTNQSESFQLVATDSHGGLGAQTLTVNITGANDTPQLSAVIAPSYVDTQYDDSFSTYDGTLVSSDRDNPESATYSLQGSVAAGLTGFDEKVVGSFGTLYLNDTTGAYRYVPNDAAIEALKTDASDPFTFVVTDGSGASASQIVSVAITGAEDMPDLGVGAGDSAGAVLTEGNGGLTAGGTLSAGDRDAGDSFSVALYSIDIQGTFEASPLTGSDYVNMLHLPSGMLAAGPNNVAWSFDSAGQPFNYLAAGEQLVIKYGLGASDGTLVSFNQDLTITIQGSNDAPTANPDSATTDENHSVQVNALANDSDPDASDNDVISSATLAGGSTGLVTIAADGHSFTYDPNGSYGYLAAGQQATATVNYTISDGHGGTAASTATITVQGVSSPPVILNTTDALGVVTELPDHAPGENVATLTDSGAINFLDADLAEMHTYTVVPQGAGYLGTLATSFTETPGTGSVFWTFSVADAALNSLGQGVVVKQYYDVTIDDGHGGSVVQTIEIDLVGSNDGAHLSSANVVIEQGPALVTASGDLTITDEDNPALFFAQSGLAGSYGHFSIAANGHWTYTADAIYSLAPNQYRTDVFTALAADGTPTTAAVTIAGHDTPAIARQDLFYTSEAAAIGPGLSLFADNGSGADSDPDSALSIAAVNGSAAAVGQLIGLPSGAVIRVNADGTFSYDPNHAFDSLAQGEFAFDQFSYTLAGGSTAVVLVDIGGVGQPGGTTGTPLDNVIYGTPQPDSIMVQQGGHDTVYALASDDGIYFGAAFDHGDAVDGGDGNDTIAIQGSTNVVLGNIVNVENLLLMSGSDTMFGDLSNNRYGYDITTNDGNVAAGATLTVIGTGLLPGENLHFDGSAETDGNFAIFAGQGVDSLIGGGGSDGFFFGADGNLTGADRVDGGAGTDTLALRGNYIGANAVVFTDASMANIEVLALLSGHSNEYSGVIVPSGFDYDITMADGNVAAGGTLDVNAAGLGSDETVRFDGRLETNASYRILAGAGDDALYGGAGNDVIYGGLGADHLEGGAGADSYWYRSAAESTGSHYDTITGFDWHSDTIDIAGNTPRAFTQAAAGALSTASFDADLAAGLSGILGASQAALFTASSGTLAGHLFAVIDMNGVAGYQAGQDLVIDLVAPITPIPTTAFVIA